MATPLHTRTDAGKFRMRLTTVNQIGEIDARKLFNLLFVIKGARNKLLLSDPVTEYAECLFSVYAEGQHITRSLLAGQTPDQDHGVMAIIAEGRRRTLLGHDLRAAVRTIVAKQFLACRRLLLRGLSFYALCRFPLLIERLNLVFRESRTAKGASEAAGLGGEQKLSPAVRALIRYTSSH